jgi:hypothetical protein
MTQTDPVAAAIAEANDAAAETAYRNQLGREMYERGRAVGRTEHVAAADAAQAAAREEPDPVLLARLDRLAQDAHAAIEERRWGPGGREHFADPRPGDFPGRGARPEREAEAG